MKKQGLPDMIVLLQEELEVPVTGKFDNATIKALDNEILFSGFVTSDTFKKSAKSEIFDMDEARAIATDHIVSERMAQEQKALESVGEKFYVSSLPDDYFAVAYDDKNPDRPEHVQAFKRGGVLMFQNGNKVAKQITNAPNQVGVTKKQLLEFAQANDQYAYDKLIKSKSFGSLGDDQKLNIGSDYRFTVEQNPETGLALNQGQVRLTDLFTGENKASKGIGSLVGKLSGLQEYVNSQTNATAEGTPDKVVGETDPTGEGTPSVGTAAIRENTPENNPALRGEGDPANKKRESPAGGAPSAGYLEALKQGRLKQQSLLSNIENALNPNEHESLMFGKDLEYLKGLRNTLLTSSRNPQGVFDGVYGTQSKNVENAFNTWLADYNERRKQKTAELQKAPEKTVTRNGWQPAGTPEPAKKQVETPVAGKVTTEMVKSYNLSKPTLFRPNDAEVAAKLDKQPLTQLSEASVEKRLYPNAIGVTKLYGNYYVKDSDGTWRMLPDNYWASKKP